MSIVSVVFTAMLILSWIILCLRLCSPVEKIGRCRKLCFFYFQNCTFSTQVFMERKKKKVFGGGQVGLFPCFRNSRNRQVPSSLRSCTWVFQTLDCMPRVSLTRLFAVPETSPEGWDFPVHLVPLSPCTFLKVVVRKTNNLTECFK